MSDFGDAAKKVQKLKYNIKEETDRSLEDAMQDVVRTMRRFLRKNDSVATRTLLEGIRTFEGPESDPIAYTSQHVVGPEYWRFLEFGTGIYTSRGYKAPGGHAPISDIETWVRAKGIVPEPDGPYDTQEELAEAIAFDITRGTRSHPFVRPSWRSLQGKRHVKESVEDGIGNAIRVTF